MIDTTTRLYLLQTLQNLSVLSQKAIQELPNQKVKIWRTLKKHLDQNIQYVYDQDFQTEANKLLTKVDQILKTNQAAKFISKSEQKLRAFPQKLTKIINDYLDLENDESENLQIPEFKERLMESVFSKEVQHWTFADLNQIVSRKWNKLQRSKFHQMTFLEKDTYNACKQFKEFFDNQNIDCVLLDELIIKRKQFKIEDSLNSSQISEISSIPGISLKSEQNPVDDSTSLSMKALLTTLNEEREGNQKVDEPKQQMKLEQNKEFKKKLKPQQEKAQESYQQKKQSQISTNETIYHSIQTCTSQRESQNQVDNSSKQPINPQKTSITTKENQSLDFISLKSFTQQQKKELDESVNFKISESILQEQKFKEYSKLMIERYQRQNRFTKGQYQAIRQNEVRNIINTQSKPLIQFLRKLSVKDVDPSSHSNSQIDCVEVYGSFANRCGFRKLSDLNINLTVKSIKDKNMHNCLFHLRNRLNFYRQGALKKLDLKSVIYSSEHGEVILSHKNNDHKVKSRNGNTINFIYITVNKKEHVKSSHFMSQVIYNSEPKNQEIAHLTNFLHLVFKRNQILDNKDIYHVWWTSNDPFKQQEKKKSQSRFVSISIYALHMMVLYYLLQKGKISKIKMNKEKMRYDFEVIDKESTIYQNFIGFLTFYSEKGDYNKLHANKEFIDVVSRNATDEHLVLNLISIQQEWAQNGLDDNLFSFIHPLASDLINESGQFDRRYLSFEVKKGSTQEELFFKKIDQLLERSKQMEENWYVEDVFDKYGEK